MHKPQLQVREFHRDVLGTPTSPAEPMFRNPELRARLHVEEAIEAAIAFVGKERAGAIVAEEFREAVHKLEEAGDDGQPNLLKALDAIGDCLFVAYGSAEDVGVDIEPFFDEIARSNMLKRDPDGSQLKSATPLGRKIKPPGWRPPDIAGVLARVVGNDPAGHGALAQLRRSIDWMEREGVITSEMTRDERAAVVRAAIPHARAEDVEEVLGRSQGSI